MAVQKYYLVRQRPTARSSFSIVWTTRIIGVNPNSHHGEMQIPSLVLIHDYLPCTPFVGDSR